MIDNKDGNSHLLNKKNWIALSLRRGQREGFFVTDELDSLMQSSTSALFLSLSLFLPCSTLLTSECSAESLGPCFFHECIYRSLSEDKFSS